MSICIGEVIAVRGIKITIKVYEQSNHEVLFYNGREYQGVSINEHLSIQRGFIDIIAKVDGEYLDESRVESGKDGPIYLRKVELQPIGHFENRDFHEGVKHLPMIGDKVFLLNKEKIYQVYSRGDGDFIIGATLKDGVRISLPWKHLFNTHIGVFGNTGSGKSNTLTKLFTTLFSDEERLRKIQRKSKFVVLDFNGEYAGAQFLPEKSKSVIELNTRTSTSSRIPISSDIFWNVDVLAILFKARENTQRPFLRRVVNGDKTYGSHDDSLERYINHVFKQMFISTSQKRESLDLMLEVISYACNHDELKKKFQKIEWHGTNEIFYIPRNGSNAIYFNGSEEKINTVFTPIKERQWVKLKCGLHEFDRFRIRCQLRLIHDLLQNYVQFEHIQPLLKRIEALVSDLSQVLEIKSELDENNRTNFSVVSLRHCNQDIKKIIPLLVAHSYYEQHKRRVQSQSEPERTLHLIIDEAHNILSYQSTRESAGWKDYRLELFEEIIKEGRKFGVFLTISSQRPADISPTIMSQIHNFFLHRLVNDKDLFLIDNTISTLDSFSRGMIPKLGKGSCVVTGTSFDMPLLIQVDRMADGARPNSDDIDLGALWGIDERTESKTS